MCHVLPAVKEISLLFFSSSFFKSKTMYVYSCCVSKYWRLCYLMFLTKQLTNQQGEHPGRAITRLLLLTKVGVNHQKISGKANK